VWLVNLPLPVCLHCNNNQASLTYSWKKLQSIVPEYEISGVSKEGLGRKCLREISDRVRPCKWTNKRVKYHRVYLIHSPAIDLCRPLGENMHKMSNDVNNNDAPLTSYAVFTHTASRPNVFTALLIMLTVPVTVESG